LNFLNNFFARLTAIIILSGCGDNTDQTLSPPKNAHWVTIKFKVPEGTTLQPMQVMYRSDTCKDTSQNSSGESYDIKGINGFKQDFTQQGHSNVWQTRIAIEGGGGCQWVLNSIKVTFKISDDVPLVVGKENLETNYIFDFDDYGFSDGYGTGEAKVSQGNIDIKTDFFPMVIVNDLFNTKYIKFFGGNVNNAQWSRRYNVHDANEIQIEPLVHMSKVVTLDSAKGHSSGMAITYPDGSIGPVNQTVPDYDKLLSIE
jgi:hypothetical protein